MHKEGKIMTDNDIKVEVNEELRQQAIDEYAAVKYVERENENRKSYVNACLIILAALGAVMLPVVVGPIINGNMRGAMTTFAVSMTFIIAVMLVVLVIILITKNYGKEADDKAMREDLEKITYGIEGGFLVRYYEGDKRRRRKFDLRKIYAVQKDGNIVTFDFKSEVIDLLDFYEPPMYDTLKEISKKNRKKK